MMLGEWLGTWKELYVEPSALAESTKAMYARAIAAVPEALLRTELQELSALDCLRWLNQVSRKTPRAAQLDRVMLSRALLVAYKLGLCPRVIIDQDTCPKPVHEAKETAILTPEQVAVYVRAAATSDCYPLLLLCLCGLRRGEALGIRWADIDLERGTVHVSAQRLRVRGHYRRCKLKSTRSDRVLELPPLVLDVLRTWPRTMRSVYVVDTSPEHLHREHVAVIGRGGLPHCTLHGLRHTMATIAAAQGVPMKLLQFALGHAKIGLTVDLYSDHLLDSVNRVPCLVFQGFLGA